MIVDSRYSFSVMLRRVGRVVVALTVATALLVAVPSAPPASAEPTAKASLTFDVSTGKVIDATDARTPVGVASTIKLLTALVAEANLDMDEPVTVTRRAADMAPLKLTMKPGSRWRAGDLMHAMLIASLNDTAMALAIGAGDGTLAGFDRAVQVESERLGLADDPVIRDPSGLDGDEGVGGGNLISARDLAIVTRAFLADPYLAGIVKLPKYDFQGGDGRPHVVYNHNAFLSIYPDAIGVKTGYTDRTGHSLVAAARRDGRTLATVVIDSPDPVAYATAHLDAAFAAGPDTPGTGDALPEPHDPPPTVETTTARATPTPTEARLASVEPSRTAPWIVGGAVVLAVLVLATLIVGVRRRSNPGAARPGRDRS